MRSFVASLSLIALFCAIAQSNDSPSKDCQCSVDDLQAKSVEATTLAATVTTLKEQLKTAEDASNSEVRALKSRVDEATAELETTKSEAAKAAQVHDSELTQAKEAKVLIKTKLEQAENKANKLAQQLQEKNKLQEQTAGAAEKELKTLRQKVKDLDENLTISNSRLKEADATLEGSDIQAYLALRRTSVDGFTVMQDHASNAYNQTQEYSKTGLEAASVHYDQASEGAARLYEKAVPMLMDSHKQAKQVIDSYAQSADPHVETAKAHFTWTLSWLTEKLQVGLTEASKSVPAISPHIEVASKIAAHVVLLLPVGAASLVVFFAIIRRVSILLLKLEYALLFVLLGLVMSFCATSFVTNQDPIAKLRSTSPETYDSFHNVLGGIAVLLALIQLSILLSKANHGGKGQVALFMTLVATGMNVILFLHYYYLVYTKAAKDPSFTMSFQIKGDGGASFAEYSIFTTAVVVASALATPADFRFSTRGLLISLEGVITGFCFGLILLSDVVKDPIGTLLKEQHATYVAAAVVGMLFLTLFSRIVTRMFSSKVEHSFVVSVGHLLLVVAVLYQIGYDPYKSLMAGQTPNFSIAAIAKCGQAFLALVVLQVILTPYTMQLAKASSSTKDSKKASGKGVKGKKHQ